MPRERCSEFEEEEETRRRRNLPLPCRLKPLMGDRFPVLNAGDWVPILGSGPSLEGGDAECADVPTGQMLRFLFAHTGNRLRPQAKIVAVQREIRRGSLVLSLSLWSRLKLSLFVSGPPSHFPGVTKEEGCS